MGRISRLSPSSIVIKRRPSSVNHKLPDFSDRFDGHSRDAFMLIFEYLKEMLLADKTAFKHVDAFTASGSHLKLDYNALLSLNIISPGSNSLLGILDRCATPPGKRMLKDWVQFPLVEPADIVERQGALQCISSKLSDHIYTRFGKLFKGLPDLERGCSKIYSKKSKIRDYLAVLEGFEGVNVRVCAFHVHVPLHRRCWPNFQSISSKTGNVQKSCPSYWLAGRIGRTYLRRFIRRLI